MGIQFGTMAQQLEQRIIIGTAGYGRYPAPEGWKEKYDSKLAAFASDFRAVELNRTFYKLPQVKTAKRWRMEAGESFVFCVKAWQAITHETSSPTWRKQVREQLSEEQKDQFGRLRPHPVNYSAWVRIRDVAEALDAPVCLVQTPPRFGPSDQNVAHLRTFMDEIEQGNLEIAWEPRGDWHEEPDRVRELVNELDLIHVVDVLRMEPVDDHRYAYVRLHGLNDDRYDYRYDYSSDELEELAGRLEELAREKERVFCMFNNVEMFSNARELRSILGNR